MRILLGVSGSIAAYKSYDLCRELTKNGHEVIVVLTQGATQFIKAETFKYLGAKNVYSANDDFNTEKYQDFAVLHIELAKWAERLAIVPASANKISQLSYGYANDLLTSIFLAFTKKVLIFPAMNTNMLNNKLIQDNIERLNNLDNIYIHSTKSGELACGDIGAGKLEDIDVIFDIILHYPDQDINKTVLITTGSTIAAIDPVRYIANPSSGLTGYELAKAYLLKGYHIILIAGYNPHPKVSSLNRFPKLKFISVKSTQEMFEAVKENMNDVDTYISAAAISDLEFEAATVKIKKGKDIHLPKSKAAQDILKYVIDHRSKQKVVGFSAETDNLENNMLEKVQRKPVDFLIGNLVSNGTQKEMQGFMQNENEYTILAKDKFLGTEKLTKAQLANRIFELVENADNL